MTDGAVASQDGDDLMTMLAGKKFHDRTGHACVVIWEK